MGLVKENIHQWPWVSIREWLARTVSSSPQHLVSPYYTMHGLPRWLSCKESTCQAGETGSTPGLGRSSGEENGNPLQYSCWDNPMDRGAWQDTVHGWGHKTVGHDQATKPQLIYTMQHATYWCCNWMRFLTVWCGRQTWKTKSHGAVCSVPGWCLQGGTDNRASFLCTGPGQWHRDSYSQGPHLL